MQHAYREIQKDRTSTNARFLKCTKYTCRNLEAPSLWLTAPEPGSVLRLGPTKLDKELGKKPIQNRLRFRFM